MRGDLHLMAMLTVQQHDRGSELSLVNLAVARDVAADEEVAKQVGLAPDGIPEHVLEILLVRDLSAAVHVKLVEQLVVDVGRHVKARILKPKRLHALVEL